MLIPIDNIIENKLHHEVILNMKFSINSKYLATYEDCAKIVVWSFNLGKEFVPLTIWKHSGAILFDWHPWVENEIVIVNCNPVSMAIIHVPSNQIMSIYRRQGTETACTSIAFNRISAELVAAFNRNAGEKNS